MKNNEISYFKTQWFRLFLGILFIVLAFIRLLSPAIDTSTLEGLQAYADDLSCVVFYLLSGIVWIISSLTSHNEARIEQLEKRVSELENRAEDN